MKRSRINQLLREAEAVFTGMGWRLPPFAYWSLAEWRQKDAGSREIVDNQLGWDVTDFGSGDFEREGLLLFTLRNGNLKLPGYPKPYAEKYMLVQPQQVTPFHFHWHKMEDIINRGGGRLVIEIYQASREEERTDEPVRVHIDGTVTTVGAGTRIILEPGQSITLLPYQYHSFWAEGGAVLAGEVSQVNDDNSDNRFLLPQQRFSQIEEDEEPVWLLCSDYGTWLAGCPICADGGSST
ncbi:MAG: D-lyxose/D-mannose family sugar isomerase [Bacillota bacterium]|nr:D-lyxose/D-mannose family sugar isomerase [Bacillota bacterium]